MGARDDILAAVRRSTSESDRTKTERDFAARCSTPRANLIPERGRGEPELLIRRFIAETEAAGASVAAVARIDDVPGAVTNYLRAKCLDNRVRAASALKNLPWSRDAGLTVGFGRARGEDGIGVSRAFAGIAETGTLMTLSGPETPMTLNFLPDTHIVLLDKRRILGSYEDAWAMLRADKGMDSLMPRTVNWITGPSRSADIELVLLLGVHGPRRLHILLIDGEET